MISKKITFRTYIKEEELSEKINSLKETDGYIVNKEGNTFYVRKSLLKRSGGSFNFFNYKILYENIKFKLQEIEIRIYPKIFILVFFILMFLGIIIMFFKNKIIAGVINLLFFCAFYYFSKKSAVEEIEEGLIKKIKKD